MIRFTLAGPPVAWGRARINSRGGKVVHIKPDQTRLHEDALGYAAKVASRGRFLEGPVRLEATFGIPIPPSWPKWKRLEAQEGTLRPTGRPDTDNYLKCVLDGLNGVIWHDDAQVVWILTRKVYAVEPFTTVRVAEWKPSTSTNKSTNDAPSDSLGSELTF